jgi:hypothetical protein
MKMEAWTVKKSLLLGGAACFLVGWQLGLQALFDPLFAPAAYTEACKSAGVRIFKRPRAPVTSVVLDSVPPPTGEAKNRYEFSVGGALRSVQSWAPRSDTHLAFVDQRRELPHGAAATSRFTRFQGGTVTVVDGSSAQVRVADEVGNAREFRKPLRQQKMVTHKLTATDLRNGDVLAEMVYVVDVERGRGCGLNARNAIDVNAFVLEATKP